MDKITSVIISLNEENNIGRCLDSLQGVADEIVVVDSHSTDLTAEICSKYEKLRFIPHDWMGYAKTKNHANNLASNDYILSIDADEALDDELRNAILEARSNGLAGAYMLKRRTNYCGRWIRFGGFYPDAKIRLFDRRKAKWKGDYVHETIALKPGEKVSMLKGKLLHYSILNREQHLAIIEKYTGLSAQQLFHQGKKTSLIVRYFSPIISFLRDYVLKLGFLDVSYGLQIARLTAYAKYLKHKKLAQLYILANQEHNNAKEL